MKTRSTAALMLTGLAVAGCGGAAKTPTIAASASSNPGAPAYAYARCMRSHGVPDFPDPKVTVSAGQVSVIMHVSQGVGSSPAFESADHACRGILPGPQNGPSPAEQHARATALLALARCMRTHGVGSFPDPNANGQITPGMLAASGINVQVPFVQNAAYACAGATHGAITAAQIHDAITHLSARSAHAGG